MKNRIISENICISNTTVRPREDRFLFDFDCVNEALINALVHNDWNISQPLVSIFTDRIEIFSHGGLPKGQTRELFFQGISKPRNDMLMRIFLSMDLVEHTGHGIPTIISIYGESVFDIGESYIRVTIPFDENVAATITERKNVGLNVGTNVGTNVGLNKTEKNVISILLERPEATADEIAPELGVTKRTIERALKSLQEKGAIIRSGAKKTGQWIVLR